MPPAAGPLESMGGCGVPGPRLALGPVPATHLRASPCEPCNLLGEAGYGPPGAVLLDRLSLLPTQPPAAGQRWRSKGRVLLSLAHWPLQVPQGLGARSRPAPHPQLSGSWRGRFDAQSEPPLCPLLTQGSGLMRAWRAESRPLLTDVSDLGPPVMRDVSPAHLGPFLSFSRGAYDCPLGPQFPHLLSSAGEPQGLTLGIR